MKSGTCLFTEFMTVADAFTRTVKKTGFRLRPLITHPQFTHMSCIGTCLAIRL